MKSVFNFSTILNLVFLFGNNFCFSQYDTSAVKIREFKKFSKEFFIAVNKNDTFFLKRHVIFPIIDASFSDMDTSLKNAKTINQNYFFNNLNKLFPLRLTKKMKESGKYLVNESNTAQKVCVIVLDSQEGEIEANYTWKFIQKKGIFYFVHFRIEAG
jgi:hypothetical protein